MLAVFDDTMRPLDSNIYDVPTGGGGGLSTVSDELPALNNNNMMLTVSDADQAVQAKPYNVNDMAIDHSELGAEAMPAQLIDHPVTFGKKWLIIGVIVVVVAIGYFIYKQSKKNNKKRF
ncbi:hypothetical protein [Pedobacter jeongneungensis]|uniref:hypothetical protein n=1 Tax=Pedobacter jeongneungensis TaxID=947309 RepID=UPI00046A5270|nr:hypothetical protein [Pedobacter jeongneungensis]